MVRALYASSILLLISRKQPGWEAWRDCLQTAASEGERLLSPIALAEFSIAYPEVAVAQADLDLLHISYDSVTAAAAYLAGKIFLRYPAQRRATPESHPRLSDPCPCNGVSFSGFPSSRGFFNELHESKVEGAKISDFRT